MSRCLVIRPRRRPEIRRVLVRRFPYRVFFFLLPDAIVVFRVLHGARHDRSGANGCEGRNTVRDGRKHRPKTSPWVQDEHPP
jgi:hypothetical protein